MVALATGGVALVTALAIAIVDTIGSAALVVTNIASAAVVVGCADGGGVTHALAALAFKALSAHSVVRADGVALATIAREAIGAVVIRGAGPCWDLVTLTSGGVALVATLAVAIVVAVGPTSAVVANIATTAIFVGFAGGGGVSHTLAAFAFKALATLLVGRTGCQALLARTSEAIGAVEVGFTGTRRQHYTFASGAIAFVASLAIAIVVTGGATAIVVAVEAILAVFVCCAVASGWLATVVAETDLACGAGDARSPLVTGS